jgi:uncharacterized membrane protein YgdD (TMEM256/DUF423 family)
MDRLFIFLGAISGFFAVMAGAFGAHGLKGRIAPEMLAVFETGARYQMYHALALLAAAWCAAHLGGRLPAAAGWLFFIGSLIFSGTLYLLSMSGVKWLGAVTPFGGLLMIAGWLCLAAAALGGKHG